MPGFRKLPTPFLLYWRERETTVYLEDVATFNKKGERTAGNLASIALRIKTLRAIGKELTRRGDWA